MGFHDWMGCFHREWSFHVAPAFPNNPKEDDGEIEVMLTDAFQGDLSNVLDLSFCRLKNLRLLKKFPVFSFHLA